jgi:hypothetical protein
MKKRNPYLGKWRITEMEMWDQDFIDIETEGHFLFEKGELGSFQFGLVQGQIDYRIERVGEVERLEFSWEGQDENDDVLGRGSEEHFGSFTGNGFSTSHIATL